MRILSEWSYKTLRVSVLYMNDRYVLKLEDTLLEQTFKFRDGQVKDVNHLRELVSDEFYEGCIIRFNDMRLSSHSLFNKESDEDAFIEII